MLEVASIILAFFAGFFGAMTIIGFMACLVWGTMTLTMQTLDGKSEGDWHLPMRAAVFVSISGAVAGTFAGLHFFLRWLA